MTDIAAIKARLEAATPGPWKVVTTPLNSCVSSRSGFVVGSDGMANYGADCENATFIAHAPADIAALLERVAELEKAIAAVGSELAWTKHVADRRKGAIGAALIELANEDVGKATSILLSTIERSEPQS